MCLIHVRADIYIGRTIKKDEYLNVSCFSCLDLENSKSNPSDFLAFN